MHSLLEDAVMVVHGAEIFDSGDAAWLFSLVRPRKLIVAGIMARVAAVESGLPCDYADQPPSAVMREMNRPCFLANHGKTPESGHIFGEIVSRRIGPAGMIHVECTSKEVICWNRPPDDLSRELADLTGYTLIAKASEPENTTAGIRVIRGCLPGEAVFVNGTVIGVATGREVVIKAGKEGVEPIEGLAAKAHGLEKLRKAGPINPATVWCKSGTIRSQRPKEVGKAPSRGRVLFVDHRGHTIFRDIPADGICGIVSVGDDTTAVCGHIGAHLGIPVFGIVDGDADRIVPAGFAPGSILAVARGISDDELGRCIAEVIPKNEVDWKECVHLFIDCIGNRAKICKPPLS